MSEVIEATKEAVKLPALSIEINGEVSASNLIEYKEVALAFIGSINTDLKTDEDFTNADKAVKYCSGVEKELDLVKEKALSKTADIKELFATIDEMSEYTRAKRLVLGKLIKDKKKAVRDGIVNAAVKSLGDHVTKIYADIKPLSFPHLGADFEKVIKGRSAIKSIKAAVGSELQAAINKADEYHEHIKTNLAKVEELAAEHKFLFNDLQQIILQEFDHFELTVSTRVKTHQDAEQVRLDKIKEDARVAAKFKLEEEAKAKEKLRIEDAQKIVHESKVAEVVEPVVETPKVIKINDEPTVMNEAVTEPDQPRSFSTSHHYHIADPKEKVIRVVDPDKDHKDDVHKAAIDDLVSWGSNSTTATWHVEQIAKGRVRGLTFSY